MSRATLGLTILFWAACSGHNYESIVVRGSDTEVNLVLRLAETFMAGDSTVSIAVTGGGSGTGIAALINKKTDIANSSRKFRESELALARERGVAITPIVFAIDALSFIINDCIPIDSLTLAEVRAIFAGTIANWREVGGPDLPISLYGRQGNSGTFLFIQEEILRTDYAPHMKQMNGSSQIVESIKNDEAAIGYVGIGYVVDKSGRLTDGIKVLRIQGEGQSRAYSPTVPAHVLSEQYVVIRPLYQYLDGRPTGKLKAFLHYELSEAGQQIIAASGYFPVSDRYRVQNRQILGYE
jgi:phosphate transport system substrate-binding protein